MKYSITSTFLGLAAVTQLANAIVLPTQQDQFKALSGDASDSFMTQDVGSEMRLVQLSPMEMKWITEDEKMELIRVGLAYSEAYGGDSGTNMKLFAGVEWS